MTSVCSISRLLISAWAPVSFMVGRLFLELVSWGGSARVREDPLSEGHWAEKTPRRGEGWERTGATRRALGDYEDGGGVVVHERSIMPEAAGRRKSLPCRRAGKVAGRPGRSNARFR